MAKVEFQANIEENGRGGWQIRLTDGFDGKEAVCENMEVFAHNIEEMGSEYGGEIEVKWSKNDNVTQDHFFQVQAEIQKIELEMEEQGKAQA